MNISPEIVSAVQQLLEQYKESLREHRASGRLQDTATAVINITNSVFQVSFLLEDYWKYVEYGRKAGKQPPIEAIEQWIRVKHVVPRTLGKVPTTKQLAHLISRSIGEKGIKSSNILSNTIKNSKMIEFIKSEITKQLKEEINKEIKEL